MGVLNFLGRMKIVKVEEEDIPVVDPSPPDPIMEPPTAETPLNWSLETVYTAAKIEMGKNSADTPLLLRDSLISRSKTPLSPEQLLMMVRAMDETDDSWNEKDALEDARRRIEALTRFMVFIDQDVAALTEVENKAYLETKNANDAAIIDLDKQIRALQIQRDQLITANEDAKVQADEAAQGFRGQGDTKKASVQVVIDRYRSLLDFFEIARG